METLLSNAVRELKSKNKSETGVIKYSQNLLDGVQVFAKRGLDLAISGLFLLLIGFWLFPLIGLLIKIDSKGPIFYKQLRDGQFNKKFNCLKFRTMVYDPESKFKQATWNDDRITKFGAFLRRTSLDEQPLFFFCQLGFKKWCFFCFG